MLELLDSESFMKTCMVIQIIMLFVALVLSFGTTEKTGKTMGWFCIGSSSLLMVLL